jgi:hypothetical protein
MELESRVRISLTAVKESYNIGTMISILLHWLLGTAAISIAILIRFPQTRRPVAWIAILLILHYA